jgi:hypothetical protein
MIYEPEDMLSLVQAAAEVNMGTASIRQACERGELPSVCKGAGQQRQHRNIRYGALMEWKHRLEQASIGHVREALDEAARASARRGALALPAESAYLTAQPTVGVGRGRSRRVA